MAVTLTVDKLMKNMSVDDIDDATELVTERLAYVTEAVTHNVPVAPDVVHNEAAIRLAGYLYDSPRAPSGTRYANAMRNSGAASILFPYRVHSAGLGTAVADANAVGIGTTGNPVTDVDIVGAELRNHVCRRNRRKRYDLPAGVGTIANVNDGRLPGPAVAMRMGWTLDTTVADADTFLRSDNHPDDGATVGTTAGLLTPPIPPVLGQAEGYRFHIWIAGAVAPVALIDAYGDNWLGEFMTPVALTISGVAGAVYSEMHSRRDTDGLYSFSAILPGLLIATQTWVTAQIANIMLSGGGITAGASAGVD